MQYGRIVIFLTNIIPILLFRQSEQKENPRAELIKYAKEEPKKEIIWIGKNSSDVLSLNVAGKRTVHKNKEIQTELNKIDTYLVLKNILDDDSVKIKQPFEFEIS